MRSLILLTAIGAVACTPPNQSNLGPTAPQSASSEAPSPNTKAELAAIDWTEVLPPFGPEGIDPAVENRMKGFAKNPEVEALANAGDPLAKSVIAWAILSDATRPLTNADRDRIHQYLADADSKNFAPAIFLSMMTRDSSEAAPYLERAAALGFGPACEMVGCETR